MFKNLYLNKYLLHTRPSAFLFSQELQLFYFSLTTAVVVLSECVQQIQRSAYLQALHQLDYNMSYLTVLFITSLQLLTSNCVLAIFQVVNNNCISSFQPFLASNICSLPYFHASNQPVLQLLVFLHPFKNPFKNPAVSTVCINSTSFDYILSAGII